MVYTPLIVIKYKLTNVYVFKEIKNKKQSHALDVRQLHDLICLMFVGAAEDDRRAHTSDAR